MSNDDSQDVKQDAGQPSVSNRLLAGGTAWDDPKAAKSEIDRLCRRVADLQSESAFYREQLTAIAQDRRKTRARRLAESALMFWDEMQREKAKRLNGEPANKQI